MLWFIVGLLTGAAVLALVLRLRGKRALKWYEWLTGAIGALLAYYAIQSFTASMAELEPRAAWLLLLLLGVPAAILMAVAAFLAWRRLHQLPAQG